MASSMPHFNYHYTNTTDLYQDHHIPITTPSSGGGRCAVSGSHFPLTYWSSNSDHQFLETYPFPFPFPFPFFNNNINIMGLPETDVLPMTSASSFHDMAVPVDLNNMQGLCGNFGYQNGGGSLCDFVDDHYRFNSTSPYSSEDNWGNQCNKTQAVEESNVKVGRYSAEERKERIERYLKKRNQRNFTKTIKYACRKTLADRRVRVRGRFARNNEEETIMKKNNVHDMPDHKLSELFSGEPVQLKHDEEDWLQEAMASLMYLPYA